MPTQILNSASLTFEYGSKKEEVLSNAAFATLQDPLNMKLSSVENSYSFGDTITYIISVANNENKNIKNIKISNNLASHNINSEITQKIITPLSYTGTSKIYIGGKFFSEIEADIFSNKIVFNIEEIPALSNALIFYSTKVNKCANLNKGSYLKNTSSLTYDNMINSIESSHTIYINEKADVNLIKYMYPNSITSGEIITYNFIMYNYGNIEAKSVAFSDEFNPAPLNLNVSVNSEPLSSKNYSYIDGKITIPSYNSDFSLSIPPAKFTQNKNTGIVTTTPGSTIITITAKI
ncbi:MAG: hypothetical protein ACI4PR_00875 [Acutalibacteraceae bacterium]